MHADVRSCVKQREQRPHERDLTIFRDITNK